MESQENQENKTLQADKATKTTRDLKNDIKKPHFYEIVIQKPKSNYDKEVLYKLINEIFPAIDVKEDLQEEDDLIKIGLFNREVVETKMEEIFNFMDAYPDVEMQVRLQKSQKLY